MIHSSVALTVFNGCDLELFIRSHPITSHTLLGFRSTLSVQSNRDGQVGKHREVEQKREKQGENICSMDIQKLEEMLQAEREERRRLELEKEKLRREREILEEQRERERGICQTVKLSNCICCRLILSGVPLN